MQLSEGNPRWKRLVSLARWVFGPAALAFLVYAAIYSRKVFGEVIRQAHFGPIVVAIALLSSLHVIVPVVSRLVLREVGVAVDYPTLLKIHLRRLPARYIPGGIWHTVSRAVDIHNLGVGRIELSTMVLVENLVSPGVAIMLGGLFFLIAGRHAAPFILAASGGFVGLCVLFLALRNRFVRRVRAFSLATYGKIVVTSVCFWLVASTAFTLYWSALPRSAANTSVAHIAGSYLIAWTAGFVNVLSPQGIGVFEATIGGLLRGALPFATVALLAAGFRAATLVADCLAYGIFQLVTRWPARRNVSLG